MKTLARIVFSFTVLFALSALLRAEPGSAEDVEWTALSQPVARIAKRDWSRPTTLEEAKAQADLVRRESIGQLLARADQFRDFQSKHPNHGKAREAKRQEAISLLQAGFHGDRERAARRQQLAREIREDRRFTQAERLEVAGYSDNLDVVAQQIAVPAELTAALEAAARGLVTEFPESPAGYESLLNLAKSGPADRAKAIYADLLEMPAPEAVKAQAAHWLDRQTLVGGSLADLVQAAPQADQRLVQTRGSIVVLYAWSVNDDASVELAKQAGSNQMPGLIFFGVNLDGPAEAKRAGETATLLPGDQLVLGHGADDPLTKALLLDETPLIYVTDRKGVLFTVSAHNRPSASIIEASLR